MNRTVEKNQLMRMRVSFRGWLEVYGFAGQQLGFKLISSFSEMTGNHLKVSVLYISILTST